MNLPRLINKALSRIEPTLGEREDEYRRAFLAADKNLVKVVCIFWAIFIAVFAYKDYLLFGASRQFWLLVALRCLLIASVATFICFSKKLTKPIDFDRAALAVALVMALFTICVNSIRPSWYRSFTIESLITLCLYFFQPGNLAWRGLPAFVLAVGAVFVAFWGKIGATVQEQFLLVVAYILANGAGIVGSAYLNSARRQRFVVDRKSQELKELWDRTFHAVPDLILVLDKEHRIVQANQAAADILGMTLEQIVGQTCFKAVHGHDAPVPSCPHSLLLADGKEHFAEVSEDRLGRTFQVSVSPLLDTDGRLYGSVHVARDITAYRSAEQALRESEERYRLLVNKANDLVFRTDANGIFSFVNPSVQRLSGYSQEEAVGRHYLEFVQPEHRKEMERFYGIQFVKKIPETYYEYPVVAKQGESIWMGQNVQLLMDGDEVVGFQAIARDITDRKKAEDALRESEERYRLLVNQANDLVFRTDANGIFTFINPTVLRLTGYSPEEVVGRNFVEFVHPEYKKEIERFYGIQVVKRIPETYCEFPLLTKSGETVWIGQNGQLLMDGDSFVGGQAIARDITDRKKAEEALRQAHDELERRVRERTSELALVNEQLRESEARFRAMFEAAEDCVFVQDRELRYTHVNPSMERLLGKPASKVLGLADEDLFGKEVAFYTREVGSRVLLGQSVEEEQTRLVNGIPATFHEIRVPLQDRSGNIVGLCGIARDITERRALLTPTQLISAAPYPSRAMSRTLEKAILAGGTDSIVLLTGESGSGKDYLARYIHDHSRRANGPFFAINCAAVPRDLAESELFGHERGSFSGAVSRKRGLLELAEGGTLLLNEIGELHLHLQAKLLTFLDSKQFTRVGGEKSITVNARLIAATNRDLEKEMEAGRFRKDLFYRVNVLSVAVPPLRERLDDIPVLVEEILAQLAKEMQLAHVPLFESSGLNALAQYHWPGNVRELRNVLERSLMHSPGNFLRVDVADSHSHPTGDWCWVATFPPKKPLNDIARDLKRSLIAQALEQSKGKKTDAARLLKISRDALKQQMKTLGLSAGDGL